MKNDIRDFILEIFDSRNTCKINKINCSEEDILGSAYRISKKNPWPVVVRDDDNFQKYENGVLTEWSW